MAAKRFAQKFWEFIVPKRYWTPTSDVSWEAYFDLLRDDEVPPFSIENAVKIPAVHACLKVLSESIAHPPKRVKRPNSDGSEDLVESHPVYFLTSTSPNPIMTAYDFWYTIVRHRFQYGNGIAEIIRDGRGIPSRLDILFPKDCKPHIDDDGDFWVIHKSRPINYRNIFHLKYHPDQGIWGCSPLEINRDTIQLSLKQQTYSKKIFGNKPPGILYTDQNLTTEQIKDYMDMWQKSTSGANMGQTPVLGGGFKYGPIMLNPQDAQFIEGRDKTDRDIFSIFNVPPTFTQNYQNANYSSTEQENLKFVKFTLAPLVVQIEQEASRKFFTPTSGMKLKIEMKGLLRGDTQTRTEYYTNMISRGIMTPNEIRELEDMKPFDGDWGDRPIVQGAFVPVDKLDDFIDSRGNTQVGESMESEKKFNYKLNLNGNGKKKETLTEN